VIVDCLHKILITLVIEAFHYSDTKGADFFNGHVERIYGLFSNLTPCQIDKLKQWYQANNDVERVCANDSTVQIARYTDIDSAFPNSIGDDSPTLGQQLASFFKKLYSQQLLDLAVLRKKIGQIDEHYYELMTVNRQKGKEKCPFCGITDMLGVYHTKREAYDHYLPKGIYPFNSINFRNLVPACHYCNSSYKLSQDPAFTPKDPARKIHRRKIFYPYSLASHEIQITVTLSKPDVENLEPSDIQLSFGPKTISEELESWQDIYGIEERYKAKCCSPDAKDWLEQIRILGDEYGVKPDAARTSVRRQAAKDPIANSNFLKLAFLEGCFRVGLWQ
jgi:hypothetical protein